MSSAVLSARQLGPLVDVHLPHTVPVVGVYTHGATALSSPQAVLYLTSKPDRGPFHVYIPELDSWLGQIEVGHVLHVSPQEIAIPAANLRVDLTAARRASRRPLTSLAPWPLIRQQANRALQQSLVRYGQRSAALTALGVVRGQPIGSASCNALCQTLVARLRALGKAIDGADPAHAVSAANGLLGLGDGLTPTGDDVLAGCLAAMWFIHAAEGSQDPSGSALRRAILSNSMARTHSLSAALLWAAASGQISEILEDILYSILTGAPITGAQLTRLANAGFSSGLDGLAGVVLVLEHFSEKRLLMAEARSQ